MLAQSFGASCFYSFFVFGTSSSFFFSSGYFYFNIFSGYFFFSCVGLAAVVAGAMSIVGAD